MSSHAQAQYLQSIARMNRPRWPAIGDAPDQSSMTGPPSPYLPGSPAFTGPLPPAGSSTSPAGVTTVPGDPKVLFGLTKKQLTYGALALAALYFVTR